MPFEPKICLPAAGSMIIERIKNTAGAAQIAVSAIQATAFGQDAGEFWEDYVDGEDGAEE